MTSARRSMVYISLQCIKLKQLSHQIVRFQNRRISTNPVFVRSVLGFSTIFRFDNLHICDIELIRSIYHGGKSKGTTCVVDRDVTAYMVVDRVLRFPTE